MPNGEKKDEISFLIIFLIVCAVIIVALLLFITGFSIGFNIGDLDIKGVLISVMKSVRETGCFTFITFHQREGNLTASMEFVSWLIH